MLALPSSISAQTAPKVWFVSRLATGANTGEGWADAFTNLHTALNQVNAGEEIWVATGVYRPTTGADRSIAFNLRSGVKIYGGFKGFEANPGQRNIFEKTTLTGDIGRPNDKSDNAYTVLYLDRPDSTTLVDGFSIINGNASTDTSFAFGEPWKSGGGVYIYAQQAFGLPVFQNCHFANNSADFYGGAVYCHAPLGNTLGNLPIFKNCSFQNNTATDGGAICIIGGADLDRGIEFDNCSFDRNLSLRNGTCIYMERHKGKGSLDFKNCRITNNYSKRGGTFMLQWDLVEGPNAVTIDGCLFKNNRSDSTDFANTLFLSPDPFLISDKHSLRVEMRNSRVELDTPQTFRSAFCHCSLDTIIVEKNVFLNLTQRLFGSAYYGIFANNYLYNVKNGLHTLGPSWKYKAYVGNTFVNINGPCMDLMGENAKLLAANNLFYNCDPGGSNLDTPFPTYYSVIEVHTPRLAGISTIDSAFIFNNLFINNKGVNYPTSSITPNVKNRTRAFAFNNIFFNNRDRRTGAKIIPLSIGKDTVHFAHNLSDVPCEGQVRLVCGPGNIASDVLWIRDTAALDFGHLPCSPALDAGDDAFFKRFGISQDVLGNARIRGDRVDLGAIEALPFSIVDSIQVVADCNGKGTGKLKLGLQGGCPPYNYHWRRGDTTGTDITQLLSGLYQITLSDSQGRKIEENISIPNKKPYFKYHIMDTIYCRGKTGYIVAEMLDFTEWPITYRWTTGSTDYTSGIMLNGLHGVTATDANGCSISQNFNVTEVPKVGFLRAIKNATGVNVADGSICIEPTSGLAPFRYVWQNGDTTRCITNLLPGNYDVTVYAANDICSLTDRIVVKVTVSASEADDNDKSARINPNPVGDWLTVTWGASQYDKWTLYSLDGKEVSKIERTKLAALTHLDLSHLVPGIYFYRFTTQHGRSKSGKLVKH